MVRAPLAAGGARSRLLAPPAPLGLYVTAVSTVGLLGLVVAVVASPWSQTFSRILIWPSIVLAVAAVVTYLRDPLWAWVVGAVGAAFLAVVLVGNRTMGPALTFLVAGLVLLGGTAAAVVLGRRRSARAGHRGAT